MQKSGKYDYILGEKIGKLTPVERLHGIIYKCKCDCGNEINVSAYRLIIGRIKSCGCDRRKKENG